MRIGRKKLPLTHRLVHLLLSFRIDNIDVLVRVALFIVADVVLGLVQWVDMQAILAGSTCQSAHCTR